MMKVLSMTEVQAVSGAGRVQDTLSSAYGNFFLHTVNVLNKLFDVGYDAEAAKQTGQDFGSRLGKAIEDTFNGLLEKIKVGVIGE